MHLTAPSCRLHPYPHAFFTLTHSQPPSWWLSLQPGALARCRHYWQIPILTPTGEGMLKPHHSLEQSPVLPQPAHTDPRGSKLHVLDGFKHMGQTVTDQAVSSQGSLSAARAALHAAPILRQRHSPQAQISSAILLRNTIILLRVGRGSGRAFTTC